MRIYEGRIVKPLHDVREPKYKKFHHPTDYTESQRFGLQLKTAQSWGLIYNSVRHPGGICIAALRPPAISLPISLAHLRYCWDGQKITEVFDVKAIPITL